MSDTTSVLPQGAGYGVGELILLVACIMAWYNPFLYSRWCVLEEIWMLLYGLISDIRDRPVL